MRTINILLTAAINFDENKVRPGAARNCLTTIVDAAYFVAKLVLKNIKDHRSDTRRQIDKLDLDI